MPKLTRKLPSYRHHKRSGQAVVNLSGKDIYLGPHGTKTSKLEYDRVIGEWLANGRRLSEHKLYEAVEAGYFPAIKYVLSTLGKSRGYTERTELEHGGQVKQIIVNMDLTLDDEPSESA